MPLGKSTRVFIDDSNRRVFVHAVVDDKVIDVTIANGDDPVQNIIIPRELFNLITGMVAEINKG